MKGHGTKTLHPSQLEISVTGCLTLALKRWRDGIREGHSRNVFLQARRGNFAMLHVHYSAQDVLMQGKTW